MLNQEVRKLLGIMGRACFRKRFIGRNRKGFGNFLGLTDI
jgi:hypothetical protein